MLFFVIHNFNLQNLKFGKIVNPIYTFPIQKTFSIFLE